MNAIEVRSLSFGYQPTTTTLQGLDFSVQKGEVFGFLGPSGSGKTTTQKILIGLLKGFEGEVKIQGKSIRDWGFDLYETIGVSFEMPNHYLKLTAEENLRYFAGLYSSATELPQTVLEWVGLAEHGKKPVMEFSKGMRNRLTLARALLHKPRLLFLDEPTAGLDPGTAHQIKLRLQELQESGTTLFLTTHNMNVAEELCDRVGFLVDGKLALVDSPRALKLAYGRRSVRVEWREENNTQQEEFALEGLADNQAFQSRLRAPGLQTIHTQETTLEEIFLQVTGKMLC
jgi:fluoroquinolone transport system ATP-binding protein